MHEPLDVRDHHRAEVVLEGLDLGGEGAEHHAADRTHGELLHAVLLRVEVLRHAALAAHATAERHAGEAAVLRVRPPVVHADVLLRVAESLAAHDRATMPAAVHEGRNHAVVLARHHDRRLAHQRGAIVARLGDFGLEAQVAPRRPAEDPLQLLPVERLIVIVAVRYARIVVARPQRLQFFGDRCGHVGGA